MRNTPVSPKADNLCELLNRLRSVRDIGVPADAVAQIHEDRFQQLVREGRISDAHQIARYVAHRRRAALGPLRVAILEAVVVKDRPWVELGRLLRTSDKTARHYAAEAITALAAWRNSETVPPPPVIRFRNEPRRL
jgi:hypothetical protein